MRKRCGGVRADRRQIVHVHPSPHSAAALPATLAAFLDRVGATTVPAPRRVHLRQRGTMWRAPGSRGMDFTAEQDLEVDRVGFTWRARFRIAPAVRMVVEDACDDATGRLDVKLWNLLPVARARGPRVARGQVQRYLGELAWVPFAIARNPSIVFRELAPRRIEVSVPIASGEHAVTFEIDDAGDIVTVSCPARPYGTGPDAIERPWGARWLRYASMDGVRVPVAAEAWWDLPQGRFTYWRGEVTDWRRDG